MFIIRLKFLSLLFLLAGFCFSLKAQQIKVKGVLLDKNTNLRISDAGIYSKGNKLLGKSNMLGEFAFATNRGDSISFKKEGYTEYQIEILTSDDLFIKLQPVIRLSEVKIISQTKKQELDEIKMQYRKKGVFYEGKPPLLSYIFNPLTALYEVFGKTPGQARRFNNFYYRELEETEISRRFNGFAVYKYSKLEGRDLQNFMDNYRPEYLQLAGWDDYQLGVYIKNSVKKFVEAGKPSAKLLPVLPKAPDLSVKTKQN